MNIRIHLLILLTVFFNAVYAQNIRISGDVCNALTQEGGICVIVKLMTADSSTILANRHHTLSFNNRKGR